MRKKFLSIFLVSILIILFMTQVIYAANMDTLYACTIYSNHFSNITDIESSMATAILSYFWRGYMGNSVSNPSTTLLTSNVMSRQVQLFFCHGNHELIAFESGSRFNCWYDT
ncbi:MAG: hypothetical protein IKM97_01630 [Clostridia bacterium]|nr:hypothetical protein [Clostridia bacterium]